MLARIAEQFVVGGITLHLGSIGEYTCITSHTCELGLVQMSVVFRSRTFDAVHGTT